MTLYYNKALGYTAYKTPGNGSSQCHASVGIASKARESSIRKARPYNCVHLACGGWCACLEHFQIDAGAVDQLAVTETTAATVAFGSMRTPTSEPFGSETA